MSKKIIIPAIIIIILLVVVSLIWWNFRAKRGVDIPTVPPPAESTVESQGKDMPLATSLAQGLEIPWALDFLPDGSIVFTERPGRIRLIDALNGLLSNFLIKGGLGREGNPFLQPMVGDAGFIVIKVVGVLICAVILWDIYRRFRKLALISTSFFVIFYALIVLWNLSLFAMA